MIGLGSRRCRWEDDIEVVKLCNLLQVSYAIGVAEPISITLFDYGTSKKTQKELLAIVKKNFDLRPGKIVK